MEKDDKILMKDLTPEKRAKIESKLLKEGVVPNIQEDANGYASMIIPADENNNLSGAAAALLPLQDSQSEKERMYAANLCANQMLNIALVLQKMTEEKKAELEERDFVANSFLQRALSFHISNLKLTSEGINLLSGTKIYPINDNFKTIPLTRSVYELLVTFFCLFILNKSEEEQTIAFNCWKINSEKNALGDLDISDSRVAERQILARQNIEDYKSIIFSTNLGRRLRNEINKHISGDRAKSGTVFFNQKDGILRIESLSYSSAWKYMSTTDKNLAFQYRMLSMHSHPIHWGLSIFINQDDKSISEAILGLHFSSIFLAKLCSYYQAYFHFDDFYSKLTAHQQGMLNSMAEAM